MHQIKFQSLIRGIMCIKMFGVHTKGKTLIAEPDNRDEAQENDKYAVGIYKKKNDASKELVGHAPVEFSSLLHHFLQASAENCINAEVIGKRKREVGLVVPMLLQCFYKEQKDNNGIG